MEVKDVLKSQRIKLGLTLKDIANSVGVSEATVSRWESGDIDNMRRDRIYKLAQVLEISPLIILGIEPKPEDPKKQNSERFLELLEPLSEEQKEKLYEIMKTLIPMV